MVSVGTMRSGARFFGAVRRFAFNISRHAIPDTRDPPRQYSWGICVPARVDIFYLLPSSPRRAPIDSSSRGRSMDPLPVFFNVCLTRAALVLRGAVNRATPPPPPPRFTPGRDRCAFSPRPEPAYRFSFRAPPRLSLVLVTELSVPLPPPGLFHFSSAYSSEELSPAINCFHPRRPRLLYFPLAPREIAGRP